MEILIKTKNPESHKLARGVPSFICLYQVYGILALEPHSFATVDLIVIHPIEASLQAEAE